MSWSVHSTIDEPVELVCAFVGHHLEMGSAEVHLCLDRRNEEVLDALSTEPQARVTICDDAYWKSSEARRRPVGQADRQTINLRRAYAESRYDWLMFCDADEFLYVDAHFRSMDGLLEMFGPQVRFFTFPVAERVYAEDEPAVSIFDGRYRRRSKRLMDAGPAIYGEKWGYFSRGLLQDGPGKSVMRTGLKLDVSIHAPKDALNAPPTGTPEDMAALRRSYLIHYDGLTPLHWALKLARWYQSMIQLLGNNEDKLRKRRTPGRNLQAETLHRNRNSPDALRELTRLQFLSAGQIDELRKCGGMADITPDIEAAARARFPEVALDFSQQSFDARLRQLHADFISGSGFNY